MSSNRLIYDKCFYKQSVEQSVGTLEYLINPIKYENNKKCRHEFGLVGGPNASEIKGNKTDLESILKGMGNITTNCDKNKFNSHKKTVINGHAGTSKRVVDTSLNHYGSCQMLKYEAAPLPDFKLEKRC
tara:strand:- start:2471 stop:2857 length:387 start_codon:yes stop_codon:yes gene_type:complete